jgi:hypothetical protein
MTAAAEPARQRRRRWRRVVVAAVLGATVLTGALGAIAVAEPDSGPGHGFADWVEMQVRRDERLHYNMHMALGKLFSLCPCTRAIGASQYSKAAYHRPRPSFAP